MHNNKKTKRLIHYSDFRVSRTPVQCTTTHQVLTHSGHCLFIAVSVRQVDK